MDEWAKWTRRMKRGQAHTERMLLWNYETPLVYTMARTYALSSRYYRSDFLLMKTNGSKTITGKNTLNSVLKAGIFLNCGFLKLPG